MHSRRHRSPSFPTSGHEPARLEPTVRPGASSPRSGISTTLPEDLQNDQLLRIQLLNAVGVLLWSLNYVMDAVLAPHGDRGPYAFLIEAGGVALSLGAIACARWGPGRTRTRIDLGVWVMVPHAFGLALLNSWTALPTTMRPVSGITVLILLFGMIAPARPRTMLLASLVAASMDPIGVWVAHLRGLPVPTALETVLMFYPNYACAVLAVAPARVMYRLGRQVREARDLGAYQLVERLGGGGMGEVWRAHHRLLARDAAVKLIRPDVLAGGSRDRADVFLSRFEREAQATAALTSPHTIRVFDYGLTAGQTFYYVMELLDGRDLQSLVQEFGPLPPARAVHLMRQVCLSLGEAHAAGLVHRDVKPANVFVCRMGLQHDFVKVLDFGLVKHEDPRQAPTQLTAAATTMGTPAYMAPEVILGLPDVDCRVDVYAAGCVLYFLLTGEPVFEAPQALSTMLRHVRDAAMPPSRRAPGPVPHDLDELVLACLDKDPARRPSDARDLLARLEGLRLGDEWHEPHAAAWWAGCRATVAQTTLADSATWSAAV